MNGVEVYTVFVGSFVDCPRLGQIRIYNDYILKIDDKGFITDFAPHGSELGQINMENLPPGTSCKVLPSHSFLLPTFCDLHLHAPQTLYLGTGLHLPLLEWLDMYAFKAEERIDNDLELASRVYTKLARRLIESGTGAALLFGTIRPESNLLLARIFQEMGLRAYVGKLSMDISTRPSYVENSTSASIDSARRFIEDCDAIVSHLPAHQRLVQPVITPRFVPSCSDTLLHQLGAMALDTGKMVQSHLAEAKDQVEWVKRDRGIDDIQVFARSGLLTPQTVQAHCTFLPESSLSQLHVAGTAIAHCPLSNAYFSSKPFPLREALDQNVKVGLGTDVAGGYQLDIMSAMRSAVVVSKLREGERVEKGLEGSALDVDWKEVLYLATTGGAIALGIPGGGVFQVGIPFDAQQIDIYDEYRSEGVGNLDFFDVPAQGLSEEMVEKWWCLGDNRNRSAVYIQGRNILE